MLAVAESWENGKPVRETLAADIPLAADHFRYFAGATRSLEGSATEIDKDTIAYHFHEPLGVVGQIIPFNFPILMAAWKLAPALAAGNCTVIKPASPTPWSLLKLAELLEDVLPPGVMNVVNGPGAEVGMALASNPRIAKIAFTGETVTGRLIMQYAAQNIIPVTLELGGKSPNIFFDDVMADDDTLPGQGDRGPGALRLQQGRGLHLPEPGAHPGVDLRPVHGTLPGPHRQDQAGKPARHLHHDRGTGLDPAAREDLLLCGHRPPRGCRGPHRRRQAHMGGELAGGYYYQPTVLKGTNDMRVFQEEIFGPVLAVTTFRDEAEAVRIANDTLYGLGAGVWTRNGSQAYRMGRAIKAGRVWTNCYHLYPAGAAFGGYKISGVGRENHRMMLEHYSQTKNLLVSYSDQPLGLLLGLGPEDDVDGPPASRRRHRRGPAGDRPPAGRSRGPIVFFQSGGCCDGSLPLCFRRGPADRRATRRAARRTRGCPFYIDHRQFEVVRHTQLVLDVAPGAPEGFSLAAGDDAHFVVRSRLFTDEEETALAG